MPGRASQSWCPYCHGPPGLDCPDKAKGPRQIRQALKRELAREAATALAEFGGRVQRHPGWRPALPDETPGACEPEATSAV